MKKLLILLTFILLPGIFINAITIHTDGSTLNANSRFHLIKSNFQIDIESLSTLYGNVTVTGNTIVNGTLNIKSTATSTGSFISYGSATGSGSTNAERYMTGTAGAGDFWHNCASAVSGQNAQNFFVDALNAIPFKNSTTYGSEFYDETNGVWTYFTTTNLPDIDTSTFLKGKGYLMRRTSNGAVTFSGSLNSGNVSPVVTRNRFGWNSIGNPYSSSIGLNTGSTSTNFLDANSSDIDPSYVAAYFWSGTGYIPFNNSDAATFIQSGQGFLIKAKTGGGIVSFTSAMQSHQANPTFYKKSSSSTWDEIILRVNSSTDTANTKILYRDDMTRGLDISYDAGLFSGSEKILLYTKLAEDNGVNFAIQCLSSLETEDLLIPLGLEYPLGGRVSFIADITGLPEGYGAILEDRLLGTFTDLSLPNAKYEVTLASGTKGTGRFFLHNFDASNEPNPQELIFVYSVKKDIYISGPVSAGSMASVYDLTGRKLADFKLEPGDMNVFKVNTLRNGIYVVKVTDNGVLKTDRVFISE